jgi:hypothetical protein
MGNENSSGRKWELVDLENENEKDELVDNAIRCFARANNLQHCKHFVG